MNSSAPFAFPVASRTGSVAPKASGFSLVELLVVMGIVSILSVIALLSVAGTKGSRELAKAAYDIQGVLEQARTLAMASGTYTWVGFFEEDPNTPGAAGTGQVVISVVSSADGTALYTMGNPIAQLPAASLVQVAKLLRVANIHLDVLAAAAAPRATVPTTTYQVASSSFVNTTTFPYPLTGSAQYTFSHIIQFSPQGDATRIADYPTQEMEIGLRPTHGDVVNEASVNVAAIQVDGIGGHVTTYRP